MDSKSTINELFRTQEEANKELTLHTIRLADELTATSSAQITHMFWYGTSLVLSQSGVTWRERMYTCTLVTQVEMIIDEKRSSQKISDHVGATICQYLPAALS